MRLAWLTDIHLDFVDDGGVALWQRVMAHAPDAIALTGDIAVAQILRATLERAAEHTTCPIYFVLGNHDFYGSSIARVREDMALLTRASPRLAWLPEAGVVSHGDIAIVGHDGWADARLGDAIGSTIALTDWVKIAELAGLSRSERIARLNALGTEAAAYLTTVMSDAAKHHARVVVLVHPPPFARACRYYGFRSPDRWLPHLACGAAGDAILDVASAFPDRRFLVLCGHTHGRAHERPRKNVEVRCGSVEYGKPTLQRVISL